MANFSLYLSGKIMDWVMGTDMPSAPPTIYVDLLDNAPTPASVLPTITGSANRQIITLNAKTPGITSYSTDNNGIVTFTNSAIANSVIENIGVYDAITGGNQLLISLTIPTPVVIGNRVRILNQELTLVVD